MTDAATRAPEGGSPLRLLLLKPYEPCPNYAASPPLGLLMLANEVRERLGAAVAIRLVDGKLARAGAAALEDHLGWADVVGLSALNYEAPASDEAAALAKRLDPATRVALGGPYAHNRSEEVLGKHASIDWVFDGEADRTFPEALARHLAGEALDGITGLSFRREGGELALAGGADVVPDLDALPWPAWDLVDLERYARAPNINQFMKGTRYATIFTSRGCPYLCAYCHDIFGKKFRWRSPDDVLGEIELLVETYGVDELQIVDDIFNLHRPRLKKIFGALRDRYGGRVHSCFPNGLRTDILDPSVVKALAEGGAYQASLAIETASPRVQTITQRNLDIEKARRFVGECNRAGILTKGFFMLGFPTESREELWSTIRFAWRSELTLATFFTVVPQPGTPIYELAVAEGGQQVLDEGETSYYAKAPWYERTYRYPLVAVVRIALLGFYLRPRRIVRFVQVLGWSSLAQGFGAFLSVLLRTDTRSWRLPWTRREALPLPEPASA